MGNAKLSVLMSIYNETESQIRESVNSILNQSFCDFEYIIVCDNPIRNKEIESLINGFKDKRIIYLINPSNIGLAMSMNKAAQHSSTNFFARMDADDVAEKNRLEYEYRAIESGQFDFVFSRFSYIDENSKPINKPLQDYWDENKIIQNRKDIPFVIHHPTVMFKRNVFEKVNGYRDFPCSQDLDLWLRMVENGCRFIMLPDALLKYRINDNSVSVKRWFLQQLTCDYIKELSLERRFKMKDSFSKESYDTYLKKQGFENKKKEKNLRKGFKYLNKSLDSRREGKIVKSIILKIFSLFTSSILRRRAFFQIFGNTTVAKSFF